MEQTTLKSPQIQENLAKLKDWELEDGGKAITRTLKFANFREAFGFMTEAALMAEKLDHHPEWTNVYSSVDIRLTTHSADGLTERDFKLAEAMDKAASARQH